MSGGAIRWLAGDPALQSRIERLLEQGLEDATPLHSTPRRSVLRVALPPAGGPDPTPSTAVADAPRELVLKLHHRAQGRHALRERVKRLLGRAPARREWRALVALHEYGVAVPRPRARARLARRRARVVSRLQLCCRSSRQS